jgi:glycosyltransferase involved in cell wall biosynthesis
MLALERIEIGFFFVGPVNTDEHVKNGLADLPNTYFIGVKKMEQLPAYLQHADCAIIPFNCTKLTKSIYPLKINEYLAAGMPVVTTRFSEDIESFGNVVYLADSHSDFLLCVDKAISENSPSLKNKRLEVANANSWSNRALQFYEIVKHYLNKK